MECPNFVFNQPIFVHKLAMDPRGCEPHTTTPCTDLRHAGGGGFATDLRHPAVVPDTLAQNFFTVDQWPNNVAQVSDGSDDEHLLAGMSSTLPVLSAEYVLSVLPHTHCEESLFDWDDFLDHISSQAKRRRVAETNDCVTHHQNHQNVTYAPDSTLQQPTTSSQEVVPKQEYPPATESPAPLQNSVTYTVPTVVGPIAVSYTLPEKTSPQKKKKKKQEKKKAQCHVCDKLFENRYKLSLHMNSHTGNRPFICEVCGKGFMRGPTMWAHRRLHADAEFKCPHCDLGFKRQPECLIHLLLQVCSRQTEFRRTSKGFMCDHCGVFLANRELVQDHCREVHKPQRACPVCGEDFAHQRGFKLLSHARAAHPDYVKNLENSIQA